jgi:hypothetical protein
MTTVLVVASFTNHFKQLIETGSGLHDEDTKAAV